MSYKIYAKKGNKVMPIKIEEKHIYKHIVDGDEVAIPVYKPNTATQDTTVGYGVNSGNIKMIHNTNFISVSQGTGEEQRIGNKINIKSLSVTLYVRFNSSVLISTFSHGQLIDTYFNFRIMTVKFDQVNLTPTDIARWYRESYIYYRTVNISLGDKYPYQSNWMDKLRESTPWTGSFKILFDKKFKLKKSKSVKQISFKLPISGQVNFDNTSNRPTENQKLSNIYTFIIGPSNVYLDMDAVSTDKCVVLGTDSATLFYINANIKTIYYDI